MFQVISKKTGKLVTICDTQKEAEQFIKFCVSINNYRDNSRDNKRNYIIKEV